MSLQASVEIGHDRILPNPNVLIHDHLPIAFDALNLYSSCWTF